MAQTTRPSSPPPIDSELFEATLNILDLLPARTTPGTKPEPFASDRWDLCSIDTWPAYSPHLVINWASISNAEWRLSAKEVALLLLQPQLAIDLRLPHARRKPFPPWSLPQQRFSYWRRWLNYLTDTGHSSLKTIAQSTCDGFLSTITPESRHIAITALRDFADYGSVLTYGGYTDGFRPWGAASAKSASGQTGLGDASNKTPPIPDSLFSPLLAACLYIVEEIGPTAHELMAQRDLLRASLSTWGGRRHNFDARLDDYLSLLRKESAPLPLARQDFGRTHQINLSMVALNIGMKDPQALLRPDRWTKLTSAADELGLAENGILIQGTGVSRSLKDIGALVRLVSTACYIVVAALSGMRHSELAAIERSAYRQEIVHGGITRYRVESKLLKGEPPGGKREVWTVIEPVVQALKMAEKVSARKHPLYPREFADRYRQMVAWTNTEGSLHGQDPIPTDWALIPRQFRRTLARELAWRPNGVIAGKIHLKHVSVASTEGYAGRRGESANAFLAEIEAERRLMHEKETRNVIAAIEAGEPIAGLGSKALVAAVRALPDATNEGAQVRDREDALIALINAKSDVLHLTPLVHCWFTDPERARCLRGVADKSKPLVGSCQPDRCVQATIHAQQVPVWLSGIEALRATIKDRRVPSGEKLRANAKVDQMMRVVEPLLEEE